MFHKSVNAIFIAPCVGYQCLSAIKNIGERMNMKTKLVNVNSSLVIRNVNRDAVGSREQLGFQ